MTNSSKLFLLDLNLTRIRNQRWAPARIQLHFFSFFLFCSAYCRVHYAPLALTCIDFGQAHIRTQVDTR